MGHDLETIIGSAYPSFIFGGRNTLLGSSSKLRLLVINLASVPGGLLVNSQLPRTLAAIQNSSMSIIKLKDTIVENFAKSKILNERVLARINRIRKRTELKEYFEILLNRKKLLCRYNEIAKKKKIGSADYFDYLLNNIDNKIEIYKYVIIIQIVLKKINEKERKVLFTKNKFERRKETCVLKLIQHEQINSETLLRLQACNNFFELDQFLDSLPPIIVFELKIRTSKHGLDHLTTKSIYKTIYTSHKK